MSNEITLAVSLDVSKAPVVFSRTLQQVLAPMTGNCIVHEVVNVATVKRALSLGDIGTPGFVLLYNLDATNFVVAGADADSPFVKLKPGEFACFRLAGGTLSIKADTAACRVEYVVLDD